MADTAAGMPVDLLVARDGGLVTLTLKGAALQPLEIGYELDVDGTSTVRQKGRARLEPNGAESLVRLTINGDRPWRATLRVTANGRDFVEERAGG